jgi:hypothetical protein
LSLELFTLKVIWASLPASPLSAMREGGSGAIRMRCVWWWFVGVGWFDDVWPRSCGWEEADERK